MYGSSCDGFTDWDNSSTTIPTNTIFGSRCFIEYDSGLSDALLADMFVGTMWNQLYFQNTSGGWSASIESQSTLVSQRWGDQYNYNGTLVVNASEPGLPDNYIEVISRWNGNNLSNRAAVTHVGQGADNGNTFTSSSRKAGNLGYVDPADHCSVVYPAATGCGNAPYTTNFPAFQPNLSTFDSTFPEDLGRGGFPDPDPPAECSNATIFVSLDDGNEEYVPGDPNVQYRNMAPGEELILVVAQDDTRPDSGWAIRPAPSLPFIPMILLDTATSGGVRATSWSYRYTAETPLFSVEFKCIDESGSAYFGLDTTYVGDEPTPASICRALVANLPEDTTISDGDDLTIGFVLPEGNYFDDDIGLDMIIAGAYSWDTVETRNSFGTLIGGSMAPYTHHVFEGTRGTITFTNVVKTAGEPNVDYPARYIRFACADSYAGYQRIGVQGELPPWVTWTPLTPLGDYEYREGGLGQCFTFPDMSLTSPASWVAGVGGMFVCIARELFVPDSQVLMSEFVELNGTLEDRPPFIAFYELVAFADTANDSFQAGSGGCFAVGQVVTLQGAVGSTNNYCPGTAVSTDTGQRSLLTAFFVGPMILGLAAHMLGLVRGSKEQELVAT